MNPNNVTPEHSKSINTFVKELDKTTLILESADQLLSAQKDAELLELDDRAARLEESYIFMLDRAIDTLNDLASELMIYRQNER